MLHLQFNKTFIQILHIIIIINRKDKILNELHMYTSVCAVGHIFSIQDKASHHE